MKKIDRLDWALWGRMGLLLALGCLLSLGAQAQAGLTWAGVERYANEGSGDEVVVAPDGSLYVTGTFTSTLTLGTVMLTAAPGTGTNTFLARYSAAGTVLWARQQYSLGPGYGTVLVRKLAVDAASNAYLAGNFSTSLTLGSTVLTAANGRSFLVKYDGQGAMQVLQQGGGAEMSIVDIAIGASGNIGLVGNSTAASTFGGMNVPGPGICYYKLAPTGTLLLGRQVGTGGAMCLALDGADNVYLTGIYGAPITFGTITLNNPHPLGAAQIYLCKLNAAGNGVWLINPTNSVYTRGGAVPTDITVDATGNAMLSQMHSDQYLCAMQVQRYNTQGNQLWFWGRSVFPNVYTNNTPAVTGVTYDSIGGCYIIGYTSDRISTTTAATSTGYQLYLVHLNSQGAELGAVQTVGTGTIIIPYTGYVGPSCRANGVAVDASGMVYVVGSATGNNVLTPSDPAHQ